MLITQGEDIFELHDSEKDGKKYAFLELSLKIPPVCLPNMTDRSPLRLDHVSIKSVHHVSFKAKQCQFIDKKPSDGFSAAVAETGWGIIKQGDRCYKA